MCGVDVESDHNTIYGGWITVNSSAVGFKIANGDTQRIHDVAIGSSDTSGTGIQVNTTLNRSYISEDVKNCAKGIDFTSGAIGTACTIIITTNGTTTPATLPSGWVAGPRQVGDTGYSNFVSINGVEYRKP